MSASVSSRSLGGGSFGSVICVPELLVSRNGNPVALKTFVHLGDQEEEMRNTCLANKIARADPDEVPGEETVPMVLAELQHVPVETYLANADVDVPRPVRRAAMSSVFKDLAQKARITYNLFKDGHEIDAEADSRCLDRRWFRPMPGCTIPDDGETVHAIAYPVFDGDLSWFLYKSGIPGAANMVDGGELVETIARVLRRNHAGDGTRRIFHMDIKLNNIFVRMPRPGSQNRKVTYVLGDWGCSHVTPDDDGDSNNNATTSWSSEWMRYFIRPWHFVAIDEVRNARNRTDIWGAFQRWLANVRDHCSWNMAYRIEEAVGKTESAKKEFVSTWEAWVRDSCVRVGGDYDALASTPDMLRLADVYSLAFCATRVIKTRERELKRMSALSGKEWRLFAPGALLQRVMVPTTDMAALLRHCDALY